MTRTHLLAATALLLTMSASAHGQTKSGETASAVAGNATTVLPKPMAPFAGQIGRTWQESTPDFPRPLAAPEGAPNVLLILTDDTGFGHASTFGGAAATPVLERLAADGLRYNRFHTTALCSPTRAALLTGRNHHSVGTGVIMEMATGYPGYNGIVPDSAVGLPEILRLNGYATGCFGKWHNTPATEVSAAGPFERWPTGSTWGCNTFYGFMAGETDQYYPVLYRNTSPIPVPRTPEQGYQLTEDLADQAIGWINSVNAANPTKPWFLYFSTGGVHAPHHVPEAYRDKYKGRFDAGWDRYREETFARQKQLGVVPADAKLTPRPKEIPAWEGQATGFESDLWELYDLDKDFTQADDIAAQNPDKLKELQAAFDEEARKYNVFPLDDRMAGRFDLSNRPNALAGLKSFTYGPGVGYIQESAAINTHQGFSITAAVERGSGSADGVLAAMGGKTSGWSLYVRNGQPMFYYNFFSVGGYRVASSEQLPEGKSTVSVQVTPEEKGYGKPAVAKLFVNGKETGAVRVEKTVPVGYSGEGFDVGADNISAVSPDYKSPFSFSGQIQSVTIAVQQ